VNCTWPPAAWACAEAGLTLTLFNARGEEPQDKATTAVTTSKKNMTWGPWRFIGDLLPGLE
jgi:hypothetical protein